MARETERRTARHLDALFAYADTLLGQGRLDSAISQLDVSTLATVMESFFISLKNSPSTNMATERWRVALSFMRGVAKQISRASKVDFIAAEQKVLKLEMLYANLQLARQGRPTRVRSLPAEVVSAIYDLVHPDSPTNPFRKGNGRWRVFVCVLTLLHLGLRRGELLLLPVDAIKSGVDSSGRRRTWVNVANAEYEDDPRYSTPAIKNHSSIRQIPISAQLTRIIDSYANNFRGQANHTFLINSQWDKPLSTESLSKCFQKISRSLPEPALRALKDWTGSETVSPHDLRHTAAVVRLNQYLASGMEMAVATQHLRTYFGWSEDSTMPLHYAKAVFDDRLHGVWDERFDERAELLRAASGGCR